ncbi:UNVERIFIED_CONTAM: hypothetical protein Sradi_0210700 [Sesamum radiatum]|uniref:Uncharacterized protein n=1 Tax=Sesamum radiatum TaxID=300843 RepID=A0AAW2W0F6_SESRA
MSMRSKRTTHVASLSPHVASRQWQGQQPPWITSALAGERPLADKTPALADKTPCRSKLLEQKDSLLTKEPSMMKTPQNSGISSNNPPN